MSNTSIYSFINKINIKYLFISVFLSIFCTILLIYFKPPNDLYSHQLFYEIDTGPSQFTSKEKVREYLDKVINQPLNLVNLNIILKDIDPQNIAKIILKDEIKNENLNNISFEKGKILGELSMNDGLIFSISYYLKFNSEKHKILEEEFIYKINEYLRNNIVAVFEKHLKYIEFLEENYNKDNKISNLFSDKNLYQEIVLFYSNPLMEFIKPIGSKKIKLNSNFSLYFLFFGFVSIVFLMLFTLIKKNK